jgi:hypothetical protein
MTHRTLPAGMWPRQQRSGNVYYYYSINRKEKELPLGSDLSIALPRYHAFERERLIQSYPDGLPIGALLTQFERSESRAVGRHAVMRRKRELELLRNFFDKVGNPTIANIGKQTDYENWLVDQPKATGFDSIRLFRMIWRFALRRGYVQLDCPWLPTSQQHERIAMEIVDILQAFSPPKLRVILSAILSTRVVPPTAPPGSPVATMEPIMDSADLQTELGVAKVRALIALRDNQREDLIPSLQKTTLQTLVDLLGSQTRLMHIPPGRIDLAAKRRKAVENLRQRHRESKSLKAERR